MPDIAMCLADNCKDKYRCYRYTATPNGPRQSYAIFHPDLNTGGKCRDFIEVDAKATERETELISALDKLLRAVMLRDGDPLECAANAAELLNRIKDEDLQDA